MLQHVTLEIARDQIDDCVAFWALLGFDRIEAPPLLRDHFIWVAHGETQIHLNPQPDPLATRYGHCAIVADDYEGMLAALHEAGFETDEGTNAWDAPRVFVREPAGNLVEVMSRSPQPPWPGE
jgi:catechol 2,3-dioxygenase-like lactoylglutathione lyase family enzyme